MLAPEIFSVTLRKRCLDARPLGRSLIDRGRPGRLWLVREPTFINRELVRFTDDERPFDYVLQFAEFEQHIGLSIPRIVATLIKDIIERRKAGGASTLTQQLARKLFLTDEKTWERKIKEALLAIQIEKRYTKHEIFTLYCNQMYFGHGVYGVEAASRLYFGKSARDLTLEEAALIAGILQGNVRQSPYVNMDAALRRRNYTLGRMAEVGFITPASAEEARKKPIVLRGEPSGQPSVAPYFLEEVRKELESRYGAKQLYENGLSIQTALDVRLQEAANRALDDGLRRIDKRRGFRKPKRNVLTEGHAIEAFRHARWERTMSVGDVVPAVVMSADGSSIRLPLRVPADRGRSQGLGWTGKAAGTQLVTRGDLVETRLMTIGPAAPPGGKGAAAAGAPAADDTAAHTATGTLEQPPLVEGAVLAIDNRTGQIKAMIGGYSFERSKFNRATQALRQVGSAFKPFVYTAAIDRGYTPTTIIMDTPASFPGGAGSPAYSPLNYDHKFEGAITLRHALEDSRNVPAVRVMEQLGPRQVISYARRLGSRISAAPVPGGRARRRGGHAHGNDERLLGVPEPGRPHAAVFDPQGLGPRGQRARGEPARAEGRDPRRHGLRDDEPAARASCSAARRRRPRRSTGRSAARPARPTTTPTRGSSASIRTSRSACGWARPEEDDRTQPDRAPKRRCRSGWTS